MMKRVLLLVVLFAGVVSMSAQLAATARISGFIRNSGQWPSNVLFLQRSANMDVWITADGFVLDQYANKDGMRSGHVVKMQWENTHTTPTAELGQVSTQVSFFKGRGQNTLTASCYETVTLNNVYSGVSVKYYTDSRGMLRYDFDVAPGYDLPAIEMGFVGDKGVHVATNKVQINTVMGGIAMTDLFAFVNKNASNETQAWFSSTAHGVKIEAPNRQASDHLTIDPVVYSTYVGGAGDDVIKTIVYSNNTAYVGGSTTGIQFPAELGAYSKSVKGLTDGFVARLSKDLGKVLGYTFFGGGDDDIITGIALDAAGKVCVTGETSSDDLPVTIGSVGQMYKAQIDGFIARFGADLTTMEIATYIGGNKDDHPRAIAVEAATGAIYIAGSTTSNAQFPTTLAHQAAFGGNEDCFLAKLSQGGGTFVFCTYYGKDGKEAITALAVDGAGSPYVTGYTSSSTFETAPTPGKWASGRVPYDRTYNGGLTDAFVIKFFPDGTLSKKDDGTYSTFFGGAGEDEGRGIYIDAQGRAVVVGVTNSKGLTAAGTLFTEKIGAQDIFMCILTDDGRGLTACTYFGGLGDDNVLGIIPEPSLNGGLMWGTTTSPEFPTTGSGAITTRNGATDAFLTVLNPYTLKFSTLMGGSSADTSVSGSFDGNGGFYFALRSTSDDLETNDLSLEKSPIGGVDGYVGKWAYGSIAMVSPVGGETWCIGINKTISWSADGMMDDDVYQIDLSNDDGKTWTSLAKDVKALSYNWKPGASLESGNDYRIRVYTARGQRQQSLAFTLSAPPKVTQDPAGVTVCDGGNAQLSVTAEGAGLRYQWRRNGTVIDGANTPLLSIPVVNTQTMGSYDCVITGACNPSVNSKAAVVTSAPKTVITKGPAGVSIAEGEQFTLTITATGQDLTYAWFRNGIAIDGANANTYTVYNATSANSGDYKCTVVGKCGTEESAAAAVTVGPTSVQQDVVAGNTTLRILGPSPATETMAVRVTVPTDATVTARLISANGDLVRTHSFGIVGAGTSTLVLPVAGVPSGVYGLELVTNDVVLRTAIQVAR